MRSALDLPDDWRDLPLDGLQGTLMILGAPDAGKSTFARYLFEQLQAHSRRVGFLDGDPGQSALGPPTTLTLSLSIGGDSPFPPTGPTWRRFIGSTSPAGHMLPVVAGAARLAEAAYTAGAEAIVYDTSGLVDPAQGGYALKMAKIDLLQPAHVFVLEQECELESLVRPLKRSQRVPVTRLQTSQRARRRSQAERQRYRAQQFETYFSGAEKLDVDWRSKAVIPAARFEPGRLLAFEDRQGFAIELGLVEEMDPRTKCITVKTPLRSMDEVARIHIGDLVLSKATYQDRISRVMWS